MENNQKTSSIKTIIEEIDKKAITLPEFQRDFVWNINQTYELFDSLVKDIFVGSIIYGIPSFEITVRELDNRPRKGEGARKKLARTTITQEEIDSKTLINQFRIVLDGQQRMTSLYRALKGIDCVYFITKNQDEQKNDDYKQLTLEDLLYEFDGQEAPSRISIKISDVFDILQGKHSRESEKESLFKISEYYKNNCDIYETNTKLYEIEFDKFLTLIEKIKELLNKDKLLSYYLLGMDSEKFALFFERSNSKGIQLNFIDILCAKLYSGFNLKQNVENFENNNSNYKFNKEIIVRALSYLASNGESKSVEKSYILSKLTPAHFVDYWATTCALYKKTLDFLYCQNFIISQAWLPYDHMLIPLMTFAYELKGDFSQMTEKQLNFIRYWYWSSIFSQRYTSSTNDKIVQDSNILKTIAKNNKLTERAYFNKLKPIITSFDDLYSYSQKGGAIYKGVLNLINYNSGGLSDWRSTNKINFNDEVDDHHIFPKGYIKESYNDEQAQDSVDCVVNRTLIPKKTNIAISKKPPSVYLRELGIDNELLCECLDKHLIPKDILQEEYDSKFIDMLKSRAEGIFKLIQDNTIEKMQKIL